MLVKRYVIFRGHFACRPMAFKKGPCGARRKGVSEFTEANIGNAIATRELLSELREAGTISGGPAPIFRIKDRSRFLQSLDQMVQRIKRKTNV